MTTTTNGSTTTPVETLTMVETLTAEVRVLMAHSRGGEGMTRAEDFPGGAVVTTGNVPPETRR